MKNNLEKYLFYCFIFFLPLENILETNFYTINHINKSSYKKAHQTSARYPKEVSEFEAVGLTEKPNNSTTVVTHDLNDFSEYYNKDGSLKKYKDDVPAAYETLFNELNKSLVTFMDKKKKADGW
jgi:hypothetical protein